MSKKPSEAGTEEELKIGEITVTVVEDAGGVVVRGKQQDVPKEVKDLFNKPQIPKNRAPEPVEHLN